MQFDEHPGDVASLVAELLVRDRRPAAAAQAWETAALLYGPATPRGRRALQSARTLAQALGR